MTEPSVSNKHEFRNAGGALVSGVNAAFAVPAPAIAIKNPAAMAANRFDLCFRISIVVSFV